MRVMHRVAIFERRTSPGAVVSGRTVVSGRVGPAPPVISPAATVGPPVQPPSAAPSPPTVGWRLGVLRRVEAMEAELDIYEQQLVTGATGLRLRATLDAAKTACGTRPSTLRDGWSGCRVERAWQRVHEARALMPVIAPASELMRLRTFAKDAAAARAVHRAAGVAQPDLPHGAGGRRDARGPLSRPHALAGRRAAVLRAGEQRRTGFRCHPGHRAAVPDRSAGGRIDVDVA